jgi:hypothetical protein
MSHRESISLTAALLAATSLRAACSSVPYAQREAAERARYEAYASKPVERFTWLGRYDSWHSLGQYELVIWPTPFDAYLIKVMPPCEDLPFANTIGLTSTASTVSARFDFVIVHRAGAGGGALSNWRCPIQEIRPVDYRRMRQDMRTEPRQGKAQENGGAGT